MEVGVVCGMDDSPIPQTFLCPESEIIQQREQVLGESRQPQKLRNRHFQAHRGEMLEEFPPQSLDDR